MTITTMELRGSDPSDQEVLVQEELAPDEIPAKWKRVMLEPDWSSRIMM